jgi:hypothetical protein
MNWLLKVAAFKVLSGVPMGAQLYRFSQEKITHSLTPTQDRVRGKIDIAFQYWDWLKANDYPGAAVPGSILDFGAGWHPTIPFLFYSLGVERQFLCDVQPVLNRDMAGQTMNTFLSVVKDPQQPYRSRLRRLPEPLSPEVSWTDYLKRMGITYHAPYDTLIGEIAGSVEIVVCTQVLYFINRQILADCFGQLRKVLKKGGIFLATVYLFDVNATAQNGLSQYNHLRYSPEVWESWINSRLMSYNRLKARDYRELLEQAGFTIRHFDVTGPTASDLEDLARVPVHPCFSHYSREELGAKNLFFVAEKT